MLWAACLVAGAAAGIPASAAAQGTKDKAAQAQALFDDGLSLMKAGKYAEACPKLQQSQKLDPAMGTQYRLAECYESAGLIGTAWALFTEVAEAAKKAGRADREGQARQHATALRPRVPMMTISLRPEIAGLPGLEVRRDGEPVDRADHNRKAPVDPGAHTITVAATRKKPWQQTVRALEGGAVEVSVPALEDDASAAASPATPDASPPRSAEASPPEAKVAGAGASPGTGQRIGALVVGVVGLGGVAVGSAFGLIAKGQWNDALSHCKGGDPTRCDASGISTGGDASRSATISTVGFVAGGAVIATALVVFLTSPSAKKAPVAVRLAPAIGLDGARGVVEGRF
jgi:hypothetical protein